PPAGSGRGRPICGAPPRSAESPDGRRAGRAAWAWPAAAVGRKLSRKALAAPAATLRQNGRAADGGETGAEAMPTLADEFARLISALHDENSKTLQDGKSSGP